MCGIFAVLQQKNTSPKLVFSGLKDIEYRGYDSWGIALFDEKNTLTIKKEIGFLPKSITMPNATVAIGHTRWATHGGVTKENAHPHTDCTKKITLVHNGIVENYQELKKNLISHVFRSETDSEIIAHLIEEEQKSSDSLFIAAKKVFAKLAGLNAVVLTNGNEIISFKKGSPLILGKLKDGYTLASDPNALIPYTKNLYFVEDNEIIHLTKNSASVFDLDKKQEKQLTFKKIDWNYQVAELKGFAHYMQKEMYEQPENIKRLANPDPQYKKTATLIKNAFGTYFIGCGTASYACLLGTYLFSKFAKRHVNFSIGSEFTYLQDFITEKSLLIAVSQSGETIDVVEPSQLTKQKKAKVIAITNVEGSTLFRLADNQIMLKSGVEKGVLGTKSFTAMLAVLIRFTFEISNQPQTGIKILEQSAKEIQSVIHQEAKIEDLAKKIKDQKDIFILGRGLSYPIALETALKIKESSYIHAEGFAAGELKHGVIALIEKGTPVIVFAPNDETKQSVLSNAMEVKSRGAFVIGISDEPNDIFDYYFQVKDTGASSILPNVVFSQLLAYHLTLLLGKNPDKPRNLAKSVVVR